MSRTKITLEVTILEAELLRRALKIAEKQERKRACYADNEMDANEAQDTAAVFNALRNAILHEVKKGGQNEKN